MPPLIIHDACVADGHSPSLRQATSLVIEGGHVTWMGPSEEVDTRRGEVLDAGGATVIPGMVDSHSHLTLPGGSHWIDRASDPAPALIQVGHENADRLVRAGILTARDVGGVTGEDPVSGNVSPLNLVVRDALRDRPQQPYIAAAGTWIAKRGYLPFVVGVDDGTGLVEAAMHQLDNGADFVKVMLDDVGASKKSPFTESEMQKMCAAVHARGSKVAAHSTHHDGALVAARAGVDSIEHGFELDEQIASAMVANHVTLVSTLSVIASWTTFQATTTIERFTSAKGRERTARLWESATASIQVARQAGVSIAAGSDFGGGSVRAGHLAWEVELLVRAGLEPWEALGAATWRGGELLGRPASGSLEVGGPADLVLVHGDPLSDPAALWRVWAVFRHGERVS
jgi:imidazolonepropionase-like amidohydrolase